MVSLRDPVRDNLLFVDFAQGVVGGCVLLAAASVLDYERLFGKLSFVPLLASFALSVLLILFGSGPGTSDAKVNLFGFQPVEIIRLLLVLLPGRLLRAALGRAAPRARNAAAAGRAHPPLRYSAGRIHAAGAGLAWRSRWLSSSCKRIWGRRWCSPACSWRSTASRAAAPWCRRPAWRWWRPGFVAGYFIGVPHTVGERVSMWLSPWDNLVHGGDQLAHSLWAFATGGVVRHGHRAGRSATGAGRAHRPDPFRAGRRVGLPGRGGGVRALRVHRLARRCASRCGRAPITNSSWRAGLAAATALQILLIAGGALGVLPLSGVVTPFLSYGRTVHAGEFPGDRDPAFDLRARPAARTGPIAVPRCRCAPPALVFAAWPARWCWPRPRYVQVLRSAGGDGRRARWWCRPMARAATSTIRASRK